MEPFEPDPPPRSPSSLEVHTVDAVDSPEFALLLWSLRSCPVVGLDAEWKPVRSVSRDHHVPPGDGLGRDSPPAAADLLPRSFPTVSLLQIACRFLRKPTDPRVGDSPVFLVDLLSVPLGALWEPLRDMFESPDVIKLGFWFKQDLIYLSSTFSAQGYDPGFDRVEPFIDITSIYYHLKNQHMGKKHPKNIKSLASICKELLNVSLSKELQCSDWSCRPLSQDQILYAAADAYYLLEIFEVFQHKIITKANNTTTIGSEKEMISESSFSNILPSPDYCEELDTLDDYLSNIAHSYGDKLLLQESDKRPRTSRRRERKRLTSHVKHTHKLISDEDWQGPPPWDISFGGDGNPKFLCDVMVEGLARHLRCVGIDAAIPSLKKPDPRHLLNQAYKEKRVLLTRDAKLLKYQYLVRNQVYRVKSLLKNDQLIEVIETFQLKISEDQLMSRCTKCNGSFIQKPLTLEEAVVASRGFQVIPNCLFDRNLEFWQCTDCKQLYWEGTQYRNAVEKFVAVCKLND
ncbi:exonuclease mut-7 homolog [Zingiber officinale]|uniref:exonuclease mut-7 homolog n=1 Tax=Zingiber officinale TaxID=94328 RepID=UPI001C4DA4EF|nr:exonuclease mut-7 homolog [Zingiber officinale]